MSNITNPQITEFKKLSLTSRLKISIVKKVIDTTNAIIMTLMKFNVGKGYSSSRAITITMVVKNPLM
ncbi:MAG: hypothetical protein ACTSWN_09710 [Promethearchaeota archaeon]